VVEAITLTGEVQGALLRPQQPNGIGVIVLTGSSGRVDVERAGLFAELGAVTLAQRWWGGEGQAPGINLITLEVFGAGIDRLQAEGCDRIVLVGTSKGAEAALLAAVHDPRVDLAVAISPTTVVWQNIGPGLDGEAWPPRSCFTLAGQALPFMTLDPRAWPPSGTPCPAYRPLYEQSFRTFAEDVAAAVIPVERARAEIILVAGAADQLWPSDTAAREIAGRLARFGRAARVIEHPGAGHSPRFPGEPARAQPPDHAWGGTPDADLALGAAAWAEITRRLELTD